MKVEKPENLRIAKDLLEEHWHSALEASTRNSPLYRSGSLSLSEWAGTGRVSINILRPAVVVWPTRHCVRSPEGAVEGDISPTIVSPRGAIPRSALRAKLAVTYGAIIRQEIVGRAATVWRIWI